MVPSDSQIFFCLIWSLLRCVVSKRQRVGSKDGEGTSGNGIYLLQEVVNFREFTVP